MGGEGSKGKGEGTSQEGFAKARTPKGNSQGYQRSNIGKGKGLKRTNVPSY